MESPSESRESHLSTGKKKIHFARGVIMTTEQHDMINITNIPTPAERTIGNTRDYFSLDSALEPSSPEHVPIQVIERMTPSNPKKNRHRIIACYVWAFAQGFSDAAPGALLPVIELYYLINYAVVLLIWIANAIGYIPIAAFYHKVEPLIGSSKSLPLSCFLACIMYAIVLSGTSFPVICVGFFCGGMGSAIAIAYGNIFLCRLQDELKYLAYHHTSYGIGAICGPLLATSAVNGGLKWNYFYLILLGLSFFNLVNSYIAFSGSETDLAPFGHHHEEEVALIKDAVKAKITWILSMFLFCYQGSEVALAGWIVTYCMDYRHGNPSTTGYIASGLWAGITIGRLFLTRPLHKRVGVRRGVILLLIWAIALVGLCWAIPNVYAIAVLAAFAGVCIGPTYPLMVTFTSLDAVVPRKVQKDSLTIMSALGLSGGAFLPFFVGLLSQPVGSFVVLPVFIGAFLVMLALWLSLPNVERNKGMW